MKRSNKNAKRIFIKNVFKESGITFHQFKALMHRLGRYSNNARKYAGKPLERRNTLRKWIIKQKNVVKGGWRYEK